MKADVWATVCGTVRDEVEFRIIIDELLKWRNRNLIQGIVFSTWQGELGRYPELHALLQQNQVDIIESTPNDERVRDIQSNSVNYWRQATQLQAALDVIPTDAVVLKTRTDRALPSTRRLVTYLDEHADLPRVSDACANYGFTTLPQEFKHKIVVLKGRTGRIMQFTDYAFLGYSADLRKIINFDVSELYLSRDLVANTQFFAYPFLRDYPIIKDYFHLINFRPLLEDLNSYTQAGGTEFPDFFKRVYAVYFAILVTHFQIISSSAMALPEPKRPIEFRDFFHSSHEGYLTHDALGVVIDSNRIIDVFMKQLAPAEQSSMDILDDLHKLSPALLERASESEMADLISFSRDRQFSGHRWLRRRRVELRTSGDEPYVSMAFPFPGISEQQQRNLWRDCLVSTNVPSVLLEFWRQGNISPKDTPTYLLSSAKAGNQYSILTLTRLLRNGRLPIKTANEVSRINNFHASMHRLHDSINIKVSCYIMAAYCYQREQKLDVDAERYKQVETVLHRYMPERTEEFHLVAGSPEKLVKLFDTEIAKLTKANKSTLRRRVIELALEVTQRGQYWALLKPLLADNEQKNRQAYDYAIKNGLLGK